MFLFVRAAEPASSPQCMRERGGSRTVSEVCVFCVVVVVSDSARYFERERSERVVRTTPLKALGVLEARRPVEKMSELLAIVVSDRHPDVPPVDRLSFAPNARARYLEQFSGKILG